MESREKNSKELGFTLIELIVTVGIMGVLASIAVANFSEYRNSVYKAELALNSNDFLTAVVAKEQDYDELSPISLISTRIEIDGSITPIASSDISISDISQFAPGYVHMKGFEVEFYRREVPGFPLPRYTIIITNCKAKIDSPDQDDYGNYFNTYQRIYNTASSKVWSEIFKSNYELSSSNCYNQNF